MAGVLGFGGGAGGSTTRVATEGLVGSGVEPAGLGLEEDVEAEAVDTGAGGAAGAGDELGFGGELVAIDDDDDDARSCGSVVVLGADAFVGAGVVAAVAVSAGRGGEGTGVGGSAGGGGAGSVFACTSAPVVEAVAVVVGASSPPLVTASAITPAIPTAPTAPPIATPRRRDDRVDVTPLAAAALDSVVSA